MATYNQSLPLNDQVTIPDVVAVHPGMVSQEHQQASVKPETTQQIGHVVLESRRNLNPLKNSLPNSPKAADKAANKLREDMAKHPGNEVARVRALLIDNSDGLQMAQAGPMRLLYQGKQDPRRKWIERAQGIYAGTLPTNIHNNKKLNALNARINQMPLELRITQISDLLMNYDGDQQVLLHQISRYAFDAILTLNPADKNYDSIVNSITDPLPKSIQMLINSVTAPIAAAGYKQRKAAERVERAAYQEAMLKMQQAASQNNGNGGGVPQQNRNGLQPQEDRVRAAIAEYQSIIDQQAAILVSQGEYNPRWIFTPELYQNAAHVVVLLHGVRGNQAIDDQINRDLRTAIDARVRAIVGQQAAPQNVPVVAQRSPQALQPNMGAAPSAKTMAGQQPIDTRGHVDWNQQSVQFTAGDLRRGQANNQNNVPVPGAQGSPEAERYLAWVMREPLQRAAANKTINAVFYSQQEYDEAVRAVQHAFPEMTRTECENEIEEELKNAIRMANQAAHQSPH